MHAHIHHVCECARVRVYIWEGRVCPAKTLSDRPPALTMRAKLPKRPRPAMMASTVLGDVSASNAFCSAFLAGGSTCGHTRHHAHHTHAHTHTHTHTLAYTRASDAGPSPPHGLAIPGPPAPPRTAFALATREYAGWRRESSWEGPARRSKALECASSGAGMSPMDVTPGSRHRTASRHESQRSSRPRSPQQTTSWDRIRSRCACARTPAAPRILPRLAPRMLPRARGEALADRPRAPWPPRIRGERWP